MHLRTLQIFCDVVARRSFSRAARAQNISQSSASQAVQQIEEHLGVQLIDRSKRPFDVTPAGEDYYAGCRELIDSYSRVEDRVRNHGETVAGRLHVAAIYSVGLLQMDAYVARYRELYPDVDLQLDYLHPDGVYERVLENKSDIGLVSFPRDGGDIASVPWQEQRLVAVLPPRHPLSGRNTLEIKDLQGEPFVGFCRGLVIRKQIDRHLRRAGVNVHVVHEFDNIENIKRAVEIGAGISILPLPTVQRETEIGTLCVASFDDVQWLRPLGVIHRRHKSHSTAASKFIELLHHDPGAFPTPAAECDSEGGLQVSPSIAVDGISHHGATTDRRPVAGNGSP